MITDPTSQRSANRAARSLGAFTIAVAGVVFVGGWMFGHPALRNLIPGTVGMKALTALGLLACGAALLLLLAPQSRRAAILGRAAAAGSLILGLAVFGEWTLGWNLGIDELLFRDGPGHAMAIAFPGRFAPTTAVCLALIGLALLTLNVPAWRRLRLSEVLIVPVAALSVLTIVGYLYEIPIFYGPASAAKMALNTGACFLALSVGVVLARPHGWLVAVAATSDPGGMMIRRLVPIIVLCPLFFGWLVLRVETAGIVSERVGMWWLTATTIGALILIATHAGHRVSADARRRTEAEQELRKEQIRSATIAASIPVGILRMDLTGRWTFVNARFRSLWHMVPGQLLADFDWLARLHPDDRERIAREWQAAMAGAGAYEAEFRILEPDGSFRWVWTRAISEHDQDGTPTGYLATTSDIHDRRCAQDKLSASEELHRLTIANLSGAAVGLYDRELRCLLMQVGDGRREMTTEQCAGKTLAEISGRLVADDLEPVMRKALAGTPTEMEYSVPGTERISSFVVTPYRGSSGGIEGVLIVSSDITARRHAELSERRASEQFRVAFEAAPIGIVLVGRDGRFAQVNAALTQISGYTSDQLCAQSPCSIIHDDDRRAVQKKFEALGAVSDSVEIEHRILHAGGHVIWIDTRATLIRDDDGKPSDIIVQIIDITERRGYERRLHHLTLHDPLTGMLNRRGLDERLEAQMAAVRRYGGSAALLMLDLDGFKLVNDTLGHAAGDQLIIGVGAAITEQLRETDVVARLGGDEFAVILPKETPEQARLVAEKLVRVIRDHAAELDGRYAGRVTASIGVVAFDGSLTAGELLNRGDLAMYEAKGNGKDQVREYSAQAC